MLYIFIKGAGMKKSLIPNAVKFMQNTSDINHSVNAKPTQYTGPAAMLGGAKI